MLITFGTIGLSRALQFAGWNKPLLVALFYGIAGIFSVTYFFKSLADILKAQMEKYSMITFFWYLDHLCEKNSACKEKLHNILNAAAQNTLYIHIKSDEKE